MHRALNWQEAVIIMRYIITFAAVLAVIASLGLIKYAQISTLVTAASAAQKAGPPPEAVSVTAATSEGWDSALSAVGNVAAAKGVTLSNDAAGIVTDIRFESGALVRQGQVLVELDHSVERAQLASAQARQELAVFNAQRSRTLASSGVVPRVQLETDEAALKASNGDREALRAQIARKVVRAPFSGRLGIRQVNLGQYLNPGAPIAVLEAVDSVFADFTLPQQRLSDIKIGTPVRVDAGVGHGEFVQGSISAIDPSVDSTTRSVRIRASLPNPEHKFLPGMFATVEVVFARDRPVVAVPTTALVRASYGDSVFVVEDKKADSTSPAGPSGQPPTVKVVRQQFVRTGDTRGDFVSILEGIKPGQQVVTSGAFKLRNGATVTVNSDTNLTPQRHPTPENR